MPLGVSSVSAVQRLFQHDVAIATYCGAVNAIDNSSMFVVVSEWRWPDWTPASASPPASRFTAPASPQGRADPSVRRAGPRGVSPPTYDVCALTRVSTIACGIRFASIRVHRVWLGELCRCFVHLRDRAHGCSCWRLVWEARFGLYGGD